MNKRDLIQINILNALLPDIRWGHSKFSASSKEIIEIRRQYTSGNEYKVKKRNVLELHEPIVLEYQQKVSNWNVKMGEIIKRNNYIKLNDYLVFNPHLGTISRKRSDDVSVAARQAKVLLLTYLWIPPQKYTESNVYPIEWLDSYFKLSNPI